MWDFEEATNAKVNREKKDDGSGEMGEKREMEIWLAKKRRENIYGKENKKKHEGLHR